MNPEDNFGWKTRKRTPKLTDFINRRDQNSSKKHTIHSKFYRRSLVSKGGVRRKAFEELIPNLKEVATIPGSKGRTLDSVEEDAFMMNDTSLMDANNETQHSDPADGSSAVGDQPSSQDSMRSENRFFHHHESQESYCGPSFSINGSSNSSQESVDTPTRSSRTIYAPNDNSNMRDHTPEIPEAYMDTQVFIN